MLMTILNFMFPAETFKSGPYTQEVTAQAIKLLYRNMFRSTVMIVFMMITTIWVMYSHIEPSYLVGWSVMATTFIILRILVIRAYVQRKPSSVDAPLWGRYFSYLSFGHGVTWGLASFLFFVPGSVPLQVFLLFLILTMGVGSIVLHAYWVESYYALIFPLFSMLSVSLMFTGNPAYLGLAIGIIPAGVIILIHVVKNASIDARESIRFRFESLDLVEQLRTEKERAEIASLDKTRFLASASHDLRQPVHALTLFAHALQQEVQGEKAKALLGDMGRSIDALNQLLVSLLDISKLDADIVKPNLTHFDLRSLMDILLSEYTPQAQAKDLTFHMQTGGEYIVCSDQALLETMLRNLISNALRYTKQGGIEVSFEYQGAEVRIAVHDTGIGIADDQRENIFREFYQITNPERDRSKGLGLGLAILKRLAALLNHRLELVSQVGQGSCFTIVLPAGERSAIPKQDELPLYLAKRDIEGMRVLVIDDEVAVREGMHAVLDGWGCETMLAGSEDEAMDQLQDQPAPHAIICDFRLRDHKTGAQAIENIRAKFNSLIPAIIVTGDTDPERLREAQRSGNALIHKPAQPGKLRAFLRNAQRRQA